MSSDGNVLPQAEIDAIFKQATGRSIAAAPEEETAPPADVLSPPVNSAGKPPAASVKPEPEEPDSRPVKAQAPVPADGSLHQLQSTLDRLANRIEKIEAAIERLEQMEEKVAGVDDNVQQLSRELNAEVIKFKGINNRVKRMDKGLDGTPGYGARTDFTCDSCGSRGLIAIPMKCTNCGKEGWWGWRPGER